MITNESFGRFRVKLAPFTHRKRAVIASALLTLTAAGCGTSSSPNEANVTGPPADLSTVSRDPDEMLRRQKQELDEYRKGLNAPGKFPTRR
jgi:hypothetical protein